MEQLFVKDFSAGWIPNDDPVGGRKTGLVKMDSLELDQHGAVILTGGTKNLPSTPNYAANAHTIYSKNISGGRYTYAALTNDDVYRNSTAIITAGGSTTRAAFGSAFDYVLICSGTEHVKDSGSAITNLGLITPTVAPSTAGAGVGVLTGAYEYCQIYVGAFNGAYVAKSARSPISTELGVSAQNITVTGRNPSSDSETQANELWIFRRGGQLEQFYRIKRLTANFTTPFEDDMSDGDALTLNIKLNEYLAPISNVNDILEMVGLINGRIIYFDKSSFYPSEINSPDSYDIRHVRGFCGSGSTGSELFLWARKISENTIIIGTTADIYALVGTFRMLPDGTLDAHLRSLSVKTPPISIDAWVQDNQIVFMANDGWRFVNSTGETVPICPPNTDRLYKGNTLNGNAGVPIYVYPATDAGGTNPRYSSCIARNKLWLRVPTIVGGDPSVAFDYRVEVYDLVRKYWRTLPIKPKMLYATEDGVVFGFFDDSGSGGNRNLREIDYQFSKNLEGGTNQTVNFLTPFFDNNQPRNRKDSLNLVLRIDTGGSNMTLKIYKDNVYSGAVTVTSTLNSSGLTEKFFDIATAVGTAKTFAFELTGTPTDFRFLDLSLYYEPRPEQIFRYVVLRQNFGQLDPHKKRVRTWPIVIDSLGGTVVVTPSVDGAAQTASNPSSIAGKKMHLHQFTSDVFGVDYSLVISSSTVFELYEVQQPEVIHYLPLAKRFFQLGPTELFKYGKIKEFDIRLVAFGGTTIPYKMYFQDDIDNPAMEGNLTVVDGKEGIVEVGAPKTTAGHIIRMELGPTAFNFHVIYARVLAAKSDRETELEWTALTPNELG